MSHPELLNRLLHGFLCIFICTALLASTGCGKKQKLPPPPPPPTAIDARLIAANDVNPDINLRPSPIVVRVYQLKSAGLFDLTDFDALYRDDRIILADDLVTKEEFHMKPGDQIEYKKKPAPGTRFLAIFGAYRNLNNAVWKKTFEIPENQTSSIQIQLNALSIDIINQTHPE